MAQLSPDEQKAYEYGQEIKHFIESDAYKFFTSQLQGLLGQEFPDPKEEGWEEQYRKAYALSQVAQTHHSLLQQLANNSEQLLKKSREEEPDFNEA